MATSGQHQQAGSAPSGAGQTIVELCCVTDCGIIFWSRQRFEIGAELQVRMRCEALTSSHLCEAPDCSADGWRSVRGFVVDCEAQRRENGSCIFRVSLLLDSAFATPMHGSIEHADQSETVTMPSLEVPVLGRTILGLN